MTEEQRYRQIVKDIVDKWITVSASKHNGAKSDILTLAEVIDTLLKERNPQ